MRGINPDMALSPRTQRMLLYGCLLLILAAGLWLRLYRYPDIPPGLNQDEASAAYDAYSIAEYGIDRNGHTFPVHFVGWGNGQSALYHYLIMPFIKVFGLSPAVSRLGNLIAHTACIAIFFFMMRSMGNPLGGLIGAFLIAFSPWSIMASRWGPEASIFPATLLVGVFLYLKAFRDPRWLPASFAVMGLSLYAYSTAYFFTPLFVLFLMYYARHMFGRVMSYLRGMAIAIFVAVAVGLPIAIFSFINLVLKDGHSLSFLGITIPKMVQTGCRYEKFVFLDPGAGGLQRFLEVLVQNFEYFYGTVILQEGAAWCVLSKYGYYFHFSNALLFVGVIAGAIEWVRAIRRKKPYYESVFLVWLLLASSLGILCETNPFRVNAIFFALFFFIAKGVQVLAESLAYCVEFFSKRRAIGRPALVGLLGVLATVYAINTSAFFGEYIKHHSDQVGVSFRESFGDAVREAESIREPGQDMYLLDQDPGTLYVYVLYYLKIDPRVFRAQVIYRNPDSEWRPVKEFGPYKFIEDRSQLPQPIEHAVCVVQNSDVATMPPKEPVFRKEYKRFTVLKY
jgi:4-amino-4-deoxy-L-arabinose transferase-like glycosyltransferase